MSSHEVQHLNQLMVCLFQHKDWKQMEKASLAQSKVNNRNIKLMICDLTMSYVFMFYVHTLYLYISYIDWQTTAYPSSQLFYAAILVQVSGCIMSPHSKDIETSGNVSPHSMVVCQVAVTLCNSFSKPNLLYLHLIQHICIECRN